MYKKPSTVDEIVISLRYEIKQNCYVVAQCSNWSSIFSEQEYDIVSSKEKIAYSQNEEISKKWIATWKKDIQDYKKYINNPSQDDTVLLQLLSEITYDSFIAPVYQRQAHKILVQEFQDTIFLDSTAKIFQQMQKRYRSRFWQACIDIDREKTLQWAHTIAKAGNGSLFEIAQAIRHLDCPLDIAITIPEYKKYWLEWFESANTFTSHLYMGPFLVKSGACAGRTEILNSIPKMHKNALRVFFNDEPLEYLREATDILEKNKNTCMLLWDRLVREYIQNPEEASQIVKLVHKDAKAYIEKLYTSITTEVMPWDKIHEQIRIQEALNIEIPLLNLKTKLAQELHLESSI